MSMRVGSGFDIHRFGGGRPLVLGGITFEGQPGLEGHSDADVVLHAAMDALLGAASLGDIGAHFPPGDPQWKDVVGFRGAIRYDPTMPDGAPRKLMDSSRLKGLGWQPRIPLAVGLADALGAHPAQEVEIGLHGT